MITLTKQQVIDFINSQPDDRKVEMENNVAQPDSCGCVMIHLGRKFCPEVNATLGAGCKNIESYVDRRATQLITTPNMAHFIFNPTRATTYKDLKQQALTW